MKIRISKLFTVLTITLVFVLTSCTRSCSRTEGGSAPSNAPAAAVRNSTPEDVVKSFIDLSATAKDGAVKAKLEQLCSGEMRRAFERMSDEVFRISYLTSNLKVGDVKVLEAATENETARVRYQIAVENTQGTDPTKEVNEREVELSRSQGVWYIDSIKLKGTDKIAFTNGMMF